MKKRYFLFFIFLSLLFSYGLFINQYDITIIPKELKAKNSDLFYDYKGVTHVLTENSTGSGTYEEIIEAAQQEELDFVYISDYQSRSSSKGTADDEDNRELIEKNTSPYIFWANKYSYINSKIINFHSKDEELLLGPGTSQIYISDLLERVDREKNLGLFLLAHPFKKNYEWPGNYPSNLNGTEIINLKQIWEGSWLNSRASFLWTLFVYPFNPRLAFIRLFEYPKEEIDLWDRLSQKQKFMGLSGSHAESKVILPFGGEFQFPKYQDLFHISKNHILIDSELTGSPENDRKKIESAISKGQFYFSLDLLANPKGFEAHIEDRKETIYPIGSEIKFRSDLSLMVHLPHKPNVPFDIIIYKNGEKLVVSNSQDTSFKIHTSGVYRVEVRVIPTFPLPDGKKWITWIYTNPFYVKEK